MLIALTTFVHHSERFERHVRLFRANQNCVNHFGNDALGCLVMNRIVADSLAWLQDSFGTVADWLNTFSTFKKTAIILSGLVSIAS
jgi:hypothetical protein